MFPSAPLLADRRCNFGVSSKLSRRPARPQRSREPSATRGYRRARAGRDFHSAAAQILPAELQATELLREPFLVVIRRRSPAGGAPKDLDRRVGAEISSFTATAWEDLASQVLVMCRSAGFEPHMGQLANGNATITGLVAAGLGIAVVPEAMCRLTANPSSAVRLMP